MKVRLEFISYTELLNAREEDYKVHNGKFSNNVPNMNNVCMDFSPSKGK